MQPKTISKNIQLKLNSWLTTIDDENLRKEVRENILVSGGSITSMLLNEEVNDYDIYINDMDVLIRLCKYYCDPIQVKVLDWRKREQYKNESFWDFDIDTVWEWHDSQEAIFLRNLKQDQVKLSTWSAGKEIIHPTPAGENPTLPSYRVLFLSPNAISLSDDIQIVCRFHGNNEQIHKTFDFIHATNYFTFKEWLVTNKEALESILCKQLKYQGSLYPLTSIIRMKKFIKRWWNISAGEMLKSMFQISELNLSDPNVVEEQLIWVDIAYFSALIEILRGTKSDEISSSYLNKMIDKVFSDISE